VLRLPTHRLASVGAIQRRAECPDLDLRRGEPLDGLLVDRQLLGGFGLGVDGVHG
jgi:hypothetical protein